MNPKEKAKEIAEKMERTITGTLIGGITTAAKRCALIAVEEITRTGLLSKSPVKHQSIADVHEEYWNQVKTEIEKL